MGDENESFFDNIILEGIRSKNIKKYQEIPICRIENTPNTPLIESTPYLPSTKSVNTSKAIADALTISANNTRLTLSLRRPLSYRNQSYMLTVSVMKDLILENCMDEKYDQAALKHLKKELLNDVKQQFFSEKDKVNLELVKTLKEQIDILKSETYFLREEMKEKNNILKMFFHSPKPSP